VWGQQVLCHGLCDVEALQVGLAGQHTAVPVRGAQRVGKGGVQTGGRGTVRKQHIRLSIACIVAQVLPRTTLVICARTAEVHHWH
jgi:hypothetical protein